MTVTKLALMWNRDIDDFEFCGVRMFKVENLAEANTRCYEDGKYIEWDVSETDPEWLTKYLETAGDDGSLNLLDEIQQNLLMGGTLVRFRSVDHLVQVWIAM